MVNYLRCVYANLLTRIGVTSLVSGLAFWCVSKHEVFVGIATILIFAGLSLLFGPALSCRTYTTFLRTRRALKDDRIDLVRATVRGDGYCAKVGVELAIKDAQKNGVGS